MCPSSAPGDDQHVGEADAEPMRWVPRRAYLMVTLLLAATCLGACGEDQPAVCSSVDAMQASVAHLRDVNVAENGLSQLQSEVAQVKKDVQQVATDAQQQYGPQVTTVKDSVATLEGSVKAAKADPSAATFAPVVAGVAAVGSAAQALGQAVSNTC